MILLFIIGVCGVVTVGAFSMVLFDVIFRGPKKKGWKK